MEKAINTTTTTSNVISLFKDILMADLESAHNENLSNTDDFDTLKTGGDTVDQYNIEQEKVLTLRLQGRNDIYIKKVNKALQRLEEGTYGECLECGEDISKQRLMARPTACFCITCKEEQERDENQTFDKKKFSAKISKTDNILPFKRA